MLVERSSILLALAGALLGCQRQDSRTARREPHLEVSWTGKNSGGLSGPATARWCGLRHVLEIQAVQGDTGVAIALYPGKSLLSGTYRVVDPAKAESLPPAAAVAVRWLGSTVVQGFRGDTGRVAIERSASALISGRISSIALSVTDTQRIRLSGTFKDLAVTQDSLGCTARDSVDRDAESPDTGLH